MTQKLQISFDLNETGTAIVQRRPCSKKMELFLYFKPWLDGDNTKNEKYEGTKHEHVPQHWQCICQTAQTQSQRFRP